MKINKNNFLFEPESKDTLIVFLHGYKGDCNELPFIKDFITKKSKFSFFAPTYGKRGEDNEVISIKNIDLEIINSINNILFRNNYKQIYFIGYSLGAAIALKVAKKFHINGLILISLFDDRKKLLRDKNIFIDEKENIIPAKLIKKIKDIPIILIHGKNDLSVPIKRANKVYKEGDKKTTFFITINTTHYFNDKNSQYILIKAIKKALKLSSIKDNLKRYPDHNTISGILKKDMLKEFST